MAKTFVRLSRPTMRKLPEGGRIFEHGIVFERTSHNDGVFSINVMVDGQRIHRVVGRESDGTTRRQAEEYVEKLRRDARENRLSLPKGRKLAFGVREAVEKYLARLEEEGGKDLKMKCKRFALHLTPFFGAIQLSKLSGFDVERYKKHRLEENVIRARTRDGKPVFGGKTKPGTVNRELAALSHLLNKAFEWGWIDRREVRIRRFREDQTRITYLTVEQIGRLLECAKSDPNEQIYLFVLVGLETAMRRSEILSIRREHIDLSRRVVFVPVAKAGAREQPITEHLADFLDQYMRALPPGTSWLFPSPAARAGHTTDIRKAFRRVVAAAGMDPDQVVRHTLRHTAITHLVQAGVDLPTVKRISGHKTLIMVERYAHANGDHIRTAMEKLESRYRNIG